MRNREIVTIGESSYEIEKLPPKIAIKILTRLIKLLGEPISKAVKGVSESNDPKKSILDTELTQLDFVAEAITALTSNLDENMILQTIELLLGYVYKKNRDGGYVVVQMDIDFQGKTNEMLKVIKSCLEVNFKDFFEEIFGTFTKIATGVRASRTE